MTSKQKSRTVTPDERESIVRDMRAGMARNELAKKYGRSGQTISAIAKAEGHDFLAELAETTRLKLARATETFKANSAERRAELAAYGLQRAQELLDEMNEPCQVFNWDKDGNFDTQTLARPPHETRVKMMQGYRWALQTAVDVSRHDEKGDVGMSQLEGWLKAMTGRT